MASGVAVIVPVADLLNPAKAITRPPKQRAKPIKMRRLKNAALVDFVFMDVVSFYFGGGDHRRHDLVPVRVTVWGLSGALSVTLSSPEKFPVREVSKYTVTLQD